jgi:hypothetical protein
MKHPWLLLSVTALAISGGQIIQAHFRLLEPSSAHKGENGGKGAPPCGEGPASNIITSVTGGKVLKLRLQEFVYHPGHYRIALAVHSLAELPPDPDVAAANGRSMSALIQSPATIPVLFDGIFDHNSAPKGEFQTDLTLPNIDCEKCTLQVIEFMAEHAPNPGGGYFYHHCADLRIKSDPTLPAADAAWSQLAR